MGLLQGYVLSFGGSDGAPMVTDGRYMSPGHRRGELRRTMFYMTILGKQDWYLLLV